MAGPAWLDRESDAWLREGLITPDQRRAILARYGGAASERWAAGVLLWLAALVAGAGLVLLVGWNWDRIPRPVQLGGIFAATAALFAAAGVVASRGHDISARRLALLGAVVSGAVFVAVADGYHATDPAAITPLWPVTLCLAAVLVPGPVTTMVAAGATIIWLLSQAGTPPPPWPFLILGPMLALSVEARPDRAAAAAVSAAVVVGVFAVGVDTWFDTFAPVMVLVLLAGAALDAWAHLPEPRRPAFARAAPAAFFLFLPLALLGRWHGFAVTSAWADGASSPWPAIGLAGALAVVAVRPALGRRSGPAARRAGLLAALGSTWLVLWLVSPPAVSGEMARWPWTIAFGAAAVLTGVSLVREAARDGDLALFLIGILTVVSFVVGRVTDAEGRLWQSAIALFAGALILGWLARTWAKRQAEAGTP